MSLDPRFPDDLGIPGRATRWVRSLLRKMSVRTSVGGLWGLLGYDDELDDGVPLFPGIGFFSRPSASSDAEVVVVKIGGSHDHPVIVATRDEDTRVELDEDETAIFNSTSIVKIKADGTIEIGSRGGTAVPLALKSDVQEVIDAMANAVVMAQDGGASLKATFASEIASSGTPSGTTKLKGE